MIRRLVMAAAGAAVLTATGAPAAHAQVRFGAEAGGPAEIRVMSYRDIPFRTVVRQEHDYSCGSAALATLLTFHYGAPRTEAAIFEAMYAVGDRKRIQSQGFSLLEMKLYLEGQGYSADGFRLTYDKLLALRTPVIAMIDTRGYRHFVVVKGIEADQVLLGDPALGMHAHSRAEFEAAWNGIAFLIRKPAKAERFNDRQDWLPYAPTPWAAAIATVNLDQSREVAALYQIAPIVNLDSILP